MSNTLLSIADARARMDEICRRIDGKRASTFTTQAKPFIEAAQRNWWLESDGKMSADRTRNIAYLTAYAELGGAAFPMTGIELADGYLRPDRAVMQALLKERKVETIDGQFHLTDEGLALIAPSRKTDPQAIARDEPSELDGIALGGRGEGENHRRLRLWAFENPSKLFPKLAAVASHTEYLLPSADRIDVLMETPEQRFAVEVKSCDSNDADLARGIYQCVKYRAVLRAITPDNVQVRVCLLTERTLPPQLNDEARRLDILCMQPAPDWRA